MKAARFYKLLISISGLALALLLTSCGSENYSQDESFIRTDQEEIPEAKSGETPKWIRELDVTDKRSAVRKLGRKVDPSRVIKKEWKTGKAE